MIYLNDNPLSADPIVSSPGHIKRFYKKHRFWKATIRIIILSSLIVLCIFYFFGPNVEWKSISDFNYSKDANFMNYLCSNQPESQLLLLEHQKVEGYNFFDEVDTIIPDEVWNNLPVKAAYYMIVRNEDLLDSRSVIKSMEDHMKNGTRYPWVLLNNQPFTSQFKKYIRKVTNAPIFFGRIDLRTWEYPYWIDVPKAEYLMLEQGLSHSIHKGISLSYHQLLRYQTGFFFHHPLLRDVEYTWRVEPGADYSCHMDDDMFMYMKENNKSLGFALTMKESRATIPTLWERVNEFKELYPEYILPSTATIYPWIYDKQKNFYNRCHFWSNFQIANLSFFRSEAYQKYFQYLDSTGNFFYERWSDAPVQTIAAALFLKKEQIHFFNNIGYSHSVASHCPYNETLLQKCSCDINSNYDFHRGSCTKRLLELIDPDTLNDMYNFIRKKNITMSIGIK
ncbi:nucleotide-diphospho-sugar transferase [Cokeromyces recurvatus]|uniref:nucleotide-diphospho-sugar transferase n=1 Tax=Cokeromyces recurvatus TaxID=90255 RepID=UPI0022210FEE|nr:nucleotide-diphospho-sugar transferase [Cokeromyces recurvatus]KAI7898248.1 nucleotide-diphospho-sugar transferase [Cokeromyces recurvatus]